MKNKRKTTAQSPQDVLDNPTGLVAEAERMMQEPASAQDEETLSRLRRRCDEAKERISAGAKSADEAIRANPYQSLAIALGAGLLVGLLLGAPADSKRLK